MGIGSVVLDKLYEREGNIHYYKVSSPHFENAEMFVAINNTRGEIEFFLTDTFENPVRKISLSSLHEPIGTIEGKEHYAYTAALRLCMRMIRENNFPQELELAS